MRDALTSGGRLLSLRRVVISLSGARTGAAGNEAVVKLAPFSGAIVSDCF
jgi:hypothetical protein